MWSQYKAMLVARCFQQTECTDDSYLPVAEMPTSKLILSYCSQNWLDIHQMDIETEFLNMEINQLVMKMVMIGFINYISYYMA